MLREHWPAASPRQETQRAMNILMILDDTTLKSYIIYCPSDGFEVHVLRRSELALFHMPAQLNPSRQTAHRGPSFLCSLIQSGMLCRGVLEKPTIVPGSKAVALFQVS